ncbi:hypothetical protein [Candidatus Coxiella mudrowiae]|uniref:hypothetical protein n=1 Tax=Candidatus Coxiella mudrowiae TaxID=2054173 RepID=UPI000C284086|nr:hypothetical protein [Candidatus Coxiella mudrowiae]
MRNGSNQYLISNHAKVWIIDNKVFYVGFHNLYPSNLQEFGVIIGNQAALTQQFINDYYDQL